MGKIAGFFLGMDVQAPGGSEGYGYNFRYHPAFPVFVSDKRELPVNRYSAFIWFPAGAAYKQGQQICPEGSVRVIGTGVRPGAISINIPPDTLVLTRLPVHPPAPWPEQRRIDQARSIIKTGRDFLVGRQTQLETDSK